MRIIRAIKDQRDECSAAIHIILSSSRFLLRFACTRQYTEAAKVELKRDEDKVDIAIDGQPVATYFYNDKVITRPYFAHVRAPGGTQVTRHHPPIEGQDVMDHPTFHPGIWMAFGDISGSDYWRLKARVRHAEFVEEPQQERGQGQVRRAERVSGPEGSRNKLFAANSPALKF